MTNSEWLRFLSDEDLAKLISSCDSCVAKGEARCIQTDCVSGRLKWLKARHSSKDRVSKKLLYHKANGGV